MTNEQEERLVAAWEGVAKALGAIHEAAAGAIAKHWPERKEPREAVVTRIPTAEDKLRAQTGNTAGPIDEWLSEFDGEEEEIGPREKAFLENKSREKHPSGAKASAPSGSDKGRA